MKIAIIGTGISGLTCAYKLHKRHPLTLQSVKKQLIKKPAMTAFIVAGIYWQALKLYMKGVPYVPYRKELT